MKNDIENKNDIETLINRFYNLLLSDDLVSHFFKEHMKLTLKKHLPIMYSFWEATLLNEGNYKGNPMMKHIELSRKSPIKKEHFDRWIKIWEETVNELFLGVNADLAIQKAKSIRSLMQFKIEKDDDMKSLI